MVVLDLQGRVRGQEFEAEEDAAIIPRHAFGVQEVLVRLGEGGAGADLQARLLPILVAARNSERLDARYKACFDAY